MTREEMLDALRILPFALIWPGNWDDVGFTEREIWVNNEGFGYIMCDEPTQTWEGPGIGADRWKQIKEKIQNQTLVYEDIEGSSIEDMLNAIHLDYCDFEDQEQLCSDLSDLALCDYPKSYFYAMATIDGTEYFDSEAQFKSAFERDWADESWESMDDELLSEWIDRLCVEDDPALVKWAQGLVLEPDICEDDFSAEIKETEERDGFWTANNTKYFRFRKSTIVYEGKKKRFVQLTAEGKEEVVLSSTSPGYAARTIFDVISTRNNVVVHYVVAGMPEDDTGITCDSDLGKWLPVKEKLYQDLLEMVKRVVGNDCMAKSLDLYYGLKDALDTNVLDDLIQFTEQSKLNGAE